MKIWQRSLLYFLLISGFSVMFILPIYSVYTGLIVGQAERVKFNLMTGGILLAVGLVFSKWILKKYERKLQAIQTVEEMGQTPATNFIIVRILKMVEIVLPLAALAFIFRGITDINIAVPAHIVIKDIIIWVSAGFIVLIFHDFLKTQFINQKKVNDALKLDLNKEKQLRKKIKKIKHKRG